jgi:hypothetical protein
MCTRDSWARNRLQACRLHGRRKSWGRCPRSPRMNGLSVLPRWRGVRTLFWLAASR